MEAEPTKAEPLRRKRRWFQFSLRTLLVFTLLCAVVSAWYCAMWHEFVREDAAVQKLTAFWAQVEWKSILPSWIDPDAPSDPTPDVECPAGHLTAFMRVSSVILDERAVRPISHDELSILADLPHLGALRILGFSDQFGDDGLAILKSLPQLTTLDLSGTNVSDRDIDRVLVLPQLQELELNRSDLTDEIVSRLAALKDLRKLVITDNPKVTDATAVIEGFPSLEEFWIEGTSISPAAIARLKRSRPRLDIYCPSLNFN